MTQVRIHQAYKSSKAETFGIQPGKFRNFATIISAIAVISVGVPLHGKSLSHGSKQSSDTPKTNVAQKNRKPFANTDFVDLSQSSTASNVLANDSDPDGDRLILLEAGAKFGAVAFTPEGLLAYAQNPGPPRADKITYTVSDGHGGIVRGLVEISAR